MRTKETEIPPFVFQLARTDPSSDPRIVLRALVEQLIPFFIHKIEENIAVYMHSKTISLTLPLDARGAGNPPARALAVFENYFRRARRAGVIREIDPRAAATLFVGSLHSYVFVNYIFKATPVPLPIPRFVDAMIDLWSHGAFTDRPPSKVKAGGKRGKKPETDR